MDVRKIIAEIKILSAYMNSASDKQQQEYFQWKAQPMSLGV